MCLTVLLCLTSENLNAWFRYLTSPAASSPQVLLMLQLRRLEAAHVCVQIITEKEKKSSRNSEEELYPPQGVIGGEIDG